MFLNTLREKLFLQIELLCWNLAAHNQVIDITPYTSTIYVKFFSKSGDVWANFRAPKLIEDRMLSK